MITFVTFHVDLAVDSLSSDTPLDSSQLLEYREILSLMLRSVSLFHHDAHQVVLTDETSVFIDLPSNIELQRYAVDSSNVMLSRLYAQLEFLKMHDFKSNIIFLDTDILVNSNLEKALSWSEFDIALTLRNDAKGMPVNGGIIFASNQYPSLVLDFFQSFYQKYVDHFYMQSQWWGDQKALVDLLTNSGEEKLSLGNKKVDNIRLLLLPCETYNYSPNFEKCDDIYGSDLNKKVIHFKGKRKQFMKPFWNICMEYKIADPTDQIRILLSHMERLQLSRQSLKSDFQVLKNQHKSLKRKFQNLEAALVKEQKDKEATSQELYMTLLQKHQKLEEDFVNLETQYTKLVQNPFASIILSLKNWLQRWQLS